MRERTKETLLKQTCDLVRCTGYDEVSLLSLSTGDYSELHELLPRIIDDMASQKVSVSLPSLRIDSLLKDDLEKMQTVRKGGLTFAPEAGTQRMRDVINKNVTEEDLLRAVTDTFTAGCRPKRTTISSALRILRAKYRTRFTVSRRTSADRASA